MPTNHDHEAAEREAYPQLTGRAREAVLARGHRQATHTGQVLFYVGDRDIDGLLSGRAAVLTATVTEPGQIVVLTRPQLRVVLAESPQLADVVLRAFLARRQLEVSEFLGGVQVIGSSFSPDTMRLRRF